MKIMEPKIEQRAEQPYMGIRVPAHMNSLPDTIGPLIGEVFGWLGQHGIKPDGAPFMRFHRINMAGEMDIEIGVPVAESAAGDDRVKSALLPAGQYAFLVYTDVTQGVPANKALLDWGAEKGLIWDAHDSDKGDVFGARYETFIDGPDDDPDPANWKTEVAIRIAD
jgi:effector-binding domain-containing protein